MDKLRQNIIFFCQEYTHIDIYCRVGASALSLTLFTSHY